MKRTAELKRTPFKRKAPLRATPNTASTSVKVAKAKCKVCRAPFTKLDMRVKWCSPDCGKTLGEKLLAERKAAAQRQAYREHRSKLSDSKPLAHWLELTQRAVNAQVRARDQGLPCISCRTTESVQWEAGHYLSRGARPELRFDIRQIRRQCHHCNVHKSGNQAAFRVGLVALLGEAEVQGIEGPHPPAKFTREALAEIRKQANAEVRRIKKERGL